ncbi:DNA helicase-2 / ATP-dependent DNA helicase PcrA [Persephonella hydrogeniphila]|uniref:DNA 3'-5' helicase n=1 Tax=Persephonella hydrogeniphila TaxID=198703 RepID=A0A285MZP4_9AQUI|nr:UvrD-helicase domain-containing protein [Persephonella hydrogeniphila]SNZ02674.1 DNA helicase-2 / ATP-dependent DNA helicase PcrA [Persephonella hydrogeniphila]
MEILEGLNEEQKKAVLHFSSPLLVLAGAGSGKTRVITHKIMYLVEKLSIPVDRILAITFTNKAASEMKERVIDALDLKEEPVWITTFHSLSAKILRIEAEHIGYNRDFVIYDEEDSKKAIKDVIKELNVDGEIYKPEKIKNVISQIKQNLDESVLDFYAFTLPHLPKIYEKYNEHLVFSNAMDFDDLLLNVVRLFRENPDILKKWQDKFDYILVDEYQDTNLVQHEILKLIVGNRDCITVVGDPQQCIYTWRGANPENILEFENDFPDTKIIKLERNYRSTEKILYVANKVIKGAKGRWKEKILKLWTDKKGGEDIHLVILETDKRESEFIGKRIKSLVEHGYNFSDFSVLIRMSYLSRNIEEAFIKHNIPYQVIGGVKFYERAEIKDILSYLRFALQPKDTQAFKRIINLPPRGIGEKTFQKIHSFFETDWIQALNDAYENLPKKVQIRVQEFLELVEYIRRHGNEKPSETAKYIVDVIGYESYLEDKYKDWEDRIANVHELFNALKEVEKSGRTFLEFLEESSLSQAQDNIQDSNTVKIMTVHAAKGLEFPVVFIAGLEDGIFPSGRAFEDIEQMEEERRLFYVAITRAKEKVFMSYARKRASFSGYLNETKPSRFLKEIKEDIKILSDKKPISKKEPVKSDTFSVGGIKKGQLVKHKAFGKGVVISINGNKATVLFENVGQKTIMKDFLETV